MFTELEQRKKYCFVKKLDDNPMLCLKCEYDYMIINKCLDLKDLKEQQKICIFLRNIV